MRAQATEPLQLTAPLPQPHRTQSHESTGHRAITTHSSLSPVAQNPASWEQWPQSHYNWQLPFPSHTEHSHMRALAIEPFQLTAPLPQPHRTQSHESTGHRAITTHSSLSPVAQNPASWEHWPQSHYNWQLPFPSHTEQLHESTGYRAITTNSSPPPIHTEHSYMRTLVIEPLQLTSPLPQPHTTQVTWEHWP